MHHALHITHYTSRITLYALRIMEQDQESKQNWETILGKLYQEFHHVKIHNTKFERRLVRVEAALDGLARNIQALLPEESSVETDLETVDKYITDYIQAHAAKKNSDVDIEGVNSNWNYFVAQKGGFDEVLYLSVQDLLSLGDDSVQFLTFLCERRKQEVEDTVDQLQEEFEKLQGNQLQQHFKSLWELHHSLLKKKMVRTWKEEVFLDAFETFISWMQQ